MRRRLSLIIAPALAVAGCGQAPADDAVLSPSITLFVTTSIDVDEDDPDTVTTTTLGPTTSFDRPVLTLPPTTLPATTAAPPTSAGPTSTPAQTTTTTTTAPVPMADARDLTGILTIDATDWDPGEVLTVTLDVTNLSDRRVTLDDRAGSRYVAARASIGADAFRSVHLWLGDTELDPGERHTMSGLWAPELDAQPGEVVVIEAVIAESADSFNRLVNTVEVIESVLAVDLPVS